MVYPRLPVHRTIVAVDVQGFGDRHRNDQNQLAVREGLYRCLQRAFGVANIPWEECHREDRGDGVLLLAGSETPKAPFIEALPQALAKALSKHNSVHRQEERIRLRMAFHAGEINYDPQGVTATSLNHAFRLLNAVDLKEALADSRGALAIIVSEWFYEEVVRHSPVENLTEYRRVEVTVKETVAAPAWIYLPDQHTSAFEITDDQQLLPQNPPHLSSVAVPQQLPAQPGRSFVGRLVELAELTAALDAEPDHEGTMAIVVTGGMGGIGKTWLALQWAHEHADRFPDGQLYVNLRGFDPLGTPVVPEVAVRGFLDALQVPPGSIPVGADAQAALYRSLVAKRRMLILLDNARYSEQVEPLLPGSSSCTVLITSRHQLSSLMARYGAKPLLLDVLSDSDAHELLVKRLGHDRVQTEAQAVQQLIQYCAGLPLALAIVAAHAATHVDFPLTALASELRETSVRLDALNGGELTANLRSVLSWSYNALEHAAAKVFCLLGLAPGPDIGLSAAAALAGITESRANVLFRQLETAHLVQRYLADRYRMHDLVRLYAADQAGADNLPENNAAAIRRLIAYFVHASHGGERLLYPHRKPIDIGPPPTGHVNPVFEDDTAILAWFDQERACLLAAQAEAVKREWHESAWQLAWTMHGYLWRRGHIHEQLLTWEAGLKAARKLGDPAMEGIAHRLLGQACARAGMQPQASDHLHKALDLAKRTGDTHGEARAYYDLTWVWRQTDDEVALTHAKQALDLFQTLDAPVWEAEALNMMGWHQAQLGRYDDAQASCERALELFRTNENRQGQAVTLDSLGYIAYHRHQYRQALVRLRESLSLCRDLGATYYEADTLDHLGLAYAALGMRIEANNAWQQALELNRAQHRTADAHRVQQQLADLDRGGGPRRGFDE